MHNMKEIEKVKMLMNKHKVTKSELARLVGEHPNKVWQWFERESIPKRHIKTVAAILQTTTDYLLD